MESKLEEFYKAETPLKDVCSYFGKKESAISSKAIELGLTSKYPKKNSNWSLCVAMLSEEDKDLLIEKLSSEFNIKGHRQRDSRYLTFDSKSSVILDDLILTFFQSDIDIVQKKILNHRGASDAKLS